MAQLQQMYVCWLSGRNGGFGRCVSYAVHRTDQIKAVNRMAPRHPDNNYLAIRTGISQEFAISLLTLPIKNPWVLLPLDPIMIISTPSSAAILRICSAGCPN